MAQRKTERLMNLFFLLLAANQYLTKDQIRASIADYRDSTPGAFERKFERDKDELRELGIAIETGSRDPYFDDEVGYRIRRDDAELPDLSFTREEAAVIGLAAQVWDSASLAGESATAVVKLKSIGVDIDTDAMRMVEPRLSAHEPAFDDVLTAATRRIPIAFSYRKVDGTESRREVEPWGLISVRDRWYLGGYDRDRRAPRLFRLARVISDVAHVGEPGSYLVPDGVNLRDLADALFPAPPTEAAVLRVRAGRAQSLRRIAELVEPIDAETDRIAVRYASTRVLAGEIAAFGPDVVAESPASLREAVITRLRAAVREDA
ncbi:WYL domain-containing protein [Aeromicrobium phragmitis]|uniref:WYL domain-containing protein n=1 Tax=Aeromicrobium phragmitis TaxID=2478914 RepID=A0A3L8PLE4_9ACTN|nr:WYL domain-containing protein [Aeromicrobium phragmitis]RLV55619.1 WYL domain-containing protein [Aeromicrobium phragmitis]